MAALLKNPPGSTSQLMTMERYAALHPEPSLDDVLDDPDRWMDEARKGNGRACVSLYRVAAAAANPHSDPGDLPSELTRRPITWLELGAARGDPQAQILYALNVGRDRVPATAPDVARDAREVQARSLRYLEAAASAGIEEAFGILAASYRDGWFGRRDAIASTAYLLALAQLSPLASDRQYAERCRDELSAFEREQATRRAAEIVAQVEAP